MNVLQSEYDIFTSSVLTGIYNGMLALIGSSLMRRLSKTGRKGFAAKGLDVSIDEIATEGELKNKIIYVYRNSIVAGYPLAPWQYAWGPGDILFADHKLASEKQKITDVPQNAVQDTLVLFRSFFEGGIRSAIGLAGPSEGDWRSSGFRKQQSTHPRGVRHS